MGLIGFLKELWKEVNSPEYKSKKLYLFDVNWDQVEYFNEKPARYLKFKEIKHYKHGKRIYVYFSKTIGGNHLGILKDFKPEAYFENITIVGVRKDGKYLVLMYE